LSHQAYREEVLLERHNRSRMLVQQLSAPERIAERLDEQEWNRTGESQKPRKKSGVRQGAVEPPTRRFN